MQAATSKRKIEANRLNAQKSTGPKTEEGKKISSQNATTHGLYSKDPILEEEDQKELQEVADDLTRRHRPKGAVEREIVQMIAGDFVRMGRIREWSAHIARKNRAARLDGTLTEEEMERDVRHFDTIERHQRTANRSIHRGFAWLRKLIAEREEEEYYSAQAQQKAHEEALAAADAAKNAKNEATDGPPQTAEQPHPDPAQSHRPPSGDIEFAYPKSVLKDMKRRLQEIDMETVAVFAA